MNNIKIGKEYTPDEIEHFLKGMKVAQMRIYPIEPQPCYFNFDGTGHYRSYDCHGTATKQITIPKQKFRDEVEDKTIALCEYCFQETTNLTKFIDQYSTIERYALQEIKEVYEKNHRFYNRRTGSFCKCNVCGDKTKYYISMPGMAETALCLSCLVNLRTVHCKDCGVLFTTGRAGSYLCPNCSEKAEEEFKKEEQRKEWREEAKAWERIKNRAPKKHLGESELEHQIMVQKYWNGELGDTWDYYEGSIAWGNGANEW